MQCANTCVSTHGIHFYDECFLSGEREKASVTVPVRISYNPYNLTITASHLRKFPCVPLVRSDLPA